MDSVTPKAKDGFWKTFDWAFLIWSLGTGILLAVASIGVLAWGGTFPDKTWPATILGVGSTILGNSSAAALAFGLVGVFWRYYQKTRCGSLVEAAINDVSDEIRNMIKNVGIEVYPKKNVPWKEWIREAKEFTITVKSWPRLFEEEFVEEWKTMLRNGGNLLLLLHSKDECSIEHERVRFDESGDAVKRVDDTVAAIRTIVGGLVAMRGRVQVFYPKHLTWMNIVKIVSNKGVVRYVFSTYHYKRRSLDDNHPFFVVNGDIQCCDWLDREIECMQNQAEPVTLAN